MNVIPSSRGGVASFGGMAAALVFCGCAAVGPDFEVIALTVPFAFIGITILTVILIPTLYAALYRIASPARP